MHLKPGDRVVLTTIHPSMRSSLKAHLGETAIVEQVITAQDLAGRGISGEHLEAHLPRVVIRFDRSDNCYGRYEVRPCYLRTQE